MSLMENKILKLGKAFRVPSPELCQQKGSSVCHINKAVLKTILKPE